MRALAVVLLLVAAARALRWLRRVQRRAEAHHADALIDQNRFRYRPERLIVDGQTLRHGRDGMVWDTMDEHLRDRTAAERKAIADALDQRRRELQAGLVHLPGQHVASFPRPREAADALHQKRRA